MQTAPSYETPSLIIAATLLAPVFSGCAKSDDQVCASYGYVPGTEGFGNCMMQREQQKMFPERAATTATNQQILYQQQMNAIQNSGNYSPAPAGASSGRLADSTDRTVSSTEAPFALAVLTTERKAA